jgi:hypothetical protein
LTSPAHLTQSDAQRHGQQAGAERTAQRPQLARQSAQNTVGQRRHVFLGNTTKLPSPPPVTADDSERRNSKRAQRFTLRDTLASITTLSRAGACGRCRVDKSAQPAVLIQGEGHGRVAHFSGVQLCGSIHACPVCSPRIRQMRADDIDAAAQAWIAKYGAGSVMLLTLTMPHDFGEELAALLRTVRASFGGMVSGKAWQTDKGRFGVEFYIVAHDTTLGVNGWHPHLHVLLFGARSLDDVDVDALGTRLHSRWTRAVTRRGHRAPSRENGLQLERARTRLDVARYVAQVVAGDDGDDARTKPVSLEMARGDLKTSKIAGHRSPWQLLADIGARRGKENWTGADDAADDADLALWREWERATKGVQAIRWARGLRAAVGLDTEEKTDEEIVSADVGGVEVFRFPDDDSWRAVAATPGARARVLAAAERGGALAVRAEVTWIREKWEHRRRKRGAIVRDKFGQSVNQAIHVTREFRHE